MLLAINRKDFLLQKLHSLCKHGVGRCWNLGIFVYGYPAFYKEHGCIQVVEGFAKFIHLNKNKAVTRILVSTVVHFTK